MYKNGSGINIDKLSETKDDSFKNGLEVTISVKTEDYNLEKAIDKLILFEKLHIEFIDKSKSYCSAHVLERSIRNFNNRNVVHYKTFDICKLESTYTGYNRFLKVGNVLYDNEEWGDFETADGIIVNIPIGEVDITPNREALQFTERTKSTIKKHLSETKKELQEITDKIFNKAFTLPQFANYISDTYINDVKDGVTFHINKKDVSIDESKITINNKSVPAGFAKFIKDSWSMYFNKDNIYKIVTDPSIPAYNKVDKGSVVFRKILLEEVHIGTKADKVTKSITLEWFKDNLKCKQCVIIYDIEVLKSHLKAYNVDFLNIEKCIDFLFDNLVLYNLSNDDVPVSYKTSHKVSKKKTKVANTDIIVRNYSGGSFTMCRLEHLKKGHMVVYSKHSKDDKYIRQLSAAITIDNICFITVKSEDLYLFENNRNYTSLEDFLDFKNTILYKLTTAVIILKNFSECGFNVNYWNRYREIPIIIEFYNKYVDYISNAYSITSSTGNVIESLIEKYTTKGWYNKVDVEYYKLNSDDISMINTAKNMRGQALEIIDSLTFLMFGKQLKLGINFPKVNICKYLKQFKYECI